MTRIIAIMALALSSCSSPRAVSQQGDPSGDPACEVVSYDLSAARFFGELAGRPPNLDAVVAGGKVHYTERSTLHGNASTDLDLFSIEAPTGEVTQITRDDRDTMLLDAKGGDLLYKSCVPIPLSDDHECDLSLRSHGKTTALGHYRSLPISYRDVTLFTLADTHLLGGGLTTWTDERAVYIYDGHQTETIALKRPPTDLPFATADAVVWSDFDGVDGEVFLWRDGVTTKIDPSTSTKSRDRFPVIAGQQVIYGCGTDADGNSGNTNICLWSASTGARVIDHGAPPRQAGHCERPVSDGQRAAWICGDVVKRYDPAMDQVETIAEAQPQLSRSGLRIAGDYLLWLEVEGGVDYYNGFGKLVFSDGTHQLDIARVGLPCIICGRYDPPMVLSLAADGWVAWSYAVDDEDTRRAYAYAQLQPRCE